MLRAVQSWAGQGGLLPRPLYARASSVTIQIRAAAYSTRWRERKVHATPRARCLLRWSVRVSVRGLSIAFGFGSREASGRKGGSASGALHQQHKQQQAQVVASPAPTPFLLGPYHVQGAAACGCIVHTDSCLAHDPRPRQRGHTALPLKKTSVTLSDFGSS